MAITAVHYWIVRELYTQGVLPQQGALLEIGEANMYGDDVPAQVFDEDIHKFVKDEQRREALLRRHAELVADPDEQWALFNKAKLFYEIFFAPTDVQAIDFNGSPLARKLDLNEPVQLEKRFDVIINHGTAEHIFNIAQVFRTIHDHCLPGGTMIHESPFTGWLEHGFYNLQPTLFFDLAEFNGYEIRAMCIEEFRQRTVLSLQSRDDVLEYSKSGKIADNALLFVVFRQPGEPRPFRFPIQAYYRGALADEGVTAWKSLR